MTADRSRENRPRNSRQREADDDVRSSDDRKTRHGRRHRPDPATDKLRREICVEAARLMYSRQVREYYRAKMKAARRLCAGWVKPSHLPTNAEIRAELQRLANFFEGESRFETLKAMRVEALRLLGLLDEFRPRLIGSVLTGHIRKGSDIDLHVFASSLAAVTGTLDGEGFDYEVERKRVRKEGVEQTFTHVHIKDRFPVELTIYSPTLHTYVFKSSITGKAIERMSRAQFEQFLTDEYPDLSLAEALADAEESIDRFAIFRELMRPLGQVKQSRKWHPEGDVLYHSLQVFDLACDERPYDEEFLLAALLHDVGKGSPEGDHVVIGLELLEGLITDRTAWLIASHMDAHRYRERTLGARARKRLEKSDDFEELMLLEECDRHGRQVGVDVPELEEALDYIRELQWM